MKIHRSRYVWGRGGEWDVWGCGGELRGEWMCGDAGGGRIRDVHWEDTRRRETWQRRVMHAWKGCY